LLSSELLLLYGKDITVNSKVRINSNNEINLERYVSKVDETKWGFSIMLDSYVMHRSCFLFCFLFYFIIIMGDLKLADVALTLGVDIDVNVSYETHVANDKSLTSIVK
jgi:hypothetical protein